VKSIEFESGQSVDEGDVLLTLNDDVDRADLAALVAAEKLADLNFKRLNKLIREKTVSQSSLDEARAELDSTRALLSAKRASIRKKTIRAAFAGKLGIRKADIGQYLAAGTQKAVTGTGSGCAGFGLSKTHIQRKNPGYQSTDRHRQPQRADSRHPGQPGSVVASRYVCRGGDTITHSK